jgi:hypothetical protein
MPKILKKTRKKPEKPGALVTVTFKADKKTLDAIATLEKALATELGPGEIPASTKSRVIRKSLQESVARLANYEPAR